MRPRLTIFAVSVASAVPWPRGVSPLAGPQSPRLRASAMWDGRESGGCWFGWVCQAVRGARRNGRWTHIAARWASMTSGRRRPRRNRWRTGTSDGWLWSGSRRRADTTARRLTVQLWSCSWSCSRLGAVLREPGE
jgi:hypothetical protein